MSDVNVGPFAGDAIQQAQTLELAVVKARNRLVPFLLLMFVLAFIDRVNVGFAKAHLQDATGISDASYAFGAGLFFITYFLFEVPSNLGLNRFGAKIWMCRIMVTWGIISTGAAFINGNVSFYLQRLLLGAAEAGFFPGMVLFLTFWFPAKWRLPIIALFYCGTPLSFVIGAPISSAILGIGAHLGLAAYQWMFVIEGLASVVVGIWAFFYLSDKPENAPWLDQRERSALTAAIQEEERKKIEAGPHSILACLRDVGLLRFIITYILIVMTNTVIQFFMPSQVAKLIGQNTGALVGVIVALPWFCALIAVLVLPSLANKYQRSRWWGAAGLVAAAIGLLGSLSHSPTLAVAALCFSLAGLYGSQPIFWQSLTKYLGGMSAVAGIAAVNAIGNLGGFFAPNIRSITVSLFGSADLGTVALAFTTFLGALLFLFLPRGAAITNAAD